MANSSSYWQELGQEVRDEGRADLERGRCEEWYTTLARKRASGPFEEIDKRHSRYCLLLLAIACYCLFLCRMGMASACLVMSLGGIG